MYYAEFADGLRKYFDTFDEAVKFACQYDDGAVYSVATQSVY